MNPILAHCDERVLITPRSQPDAIIAASGWLPLPSVPARCSKTKSPGGTRALSARSVLTGNRHPRADRWSVGAAVTAAEERPEPIVQTNFEHLNLATRRESVPQERPRSK